MDPSKTKPIITKQHLINGGYTLLKNLSTMDLTKEDNIDLARGHMYAVATNNITGFNTYVNEFNGMGYNMGQVQDILHNANDRDALINAFWLLGIYKKLDPDS